MWLEQALGLGGGGLKAGVGEIKFCEWPERLKNSSLWNHTTPEKKMLHLGQGHLSQNVSRLGHKDTVTSKSKSFL